jgi:hypothetical protein
MQGRSMSHPITQEAPGLSPVCRHHWVIDTPNGAVSGGRCKRCGAAREFRNSSEDLMWDSDSFSLNGSRYRGRRGTPSTPAGLS